MFTAFRTHRYTAISIIAFCLCLFTACASTPISTGNTTAPTATTTGHAITATGTTATTNMPTIAVTAIPSTPGIAPTVILSPTPIPGGGPHSQQVLFADRVLLINNVSRGTGTNASSVTIRLTMTLKNTSAKTITNVATYYSLFGSEGDVFGLPSNTDGSFFGVIAANGSRSGTIVFQVPLGADTTLRLLYRPEVARETVFVPIHD